MSRAGLHPDSEGRLPEYQPFPNERGRNYRQENWELPALIWCLALPSGVRMLEIGCGRGVAIPVLAEICAPERIVGLDIDATLLAEAERHCLEVGAKAELVVGDARQMPFDAAAFDVVIDFGTLYHIAQPERALMEVVRVLAPGGLFAYETLISQALSHPIRSRGRSIPWAAAPPLVPRRWAVLWGSRIKAG
jgi:ubiquinone/menaquinone biosynthesis C-methylase UbiE